MSNGSNYAHMWRCAKCFYHFANIAEVEGFLKEEKKCPKCKSLNTLTLTRKEITIHCLLYDPDTDTKDAKDINDEFEKASSYDNGHY